MTLAENVGVCVFCGKEFVFKFDGHRIRPRPYCEERCRRRSRYRSEPPTIKLPVKHRKRGVAMRRLRPSLVKLLAFWNVRPGTMQAHCPHKAGTHTWNNTIRLGEQPASRLWEYWERAKQAYEDRIKQHHPDRGGDSQVAATLNAAWDRTRELFARRGIGDMTVRRTLFGWQRV